MDRIKPVYVRMQEKKLHSLMVYSMIFGFAIGCLVAYVCIIFLNVFGIIK